jgi:hypothetical protein
VDKERDGWQSRGMGGSVDGWTAKSELSRGLGG